jgi:L-fuconolactonase
MAAEDEILDSHQHFWNLADYDQPWLRRPGNEPLLRDFSEDDLRPMAAAAGVRATVVVQTVIGPGETADLLARAAASDLVAGVVGWVDLQADDVADALAALQERPDGRYLRGIRHPVLAEPDPGWLHRPSVHAGLAAVGVAGLCYDIVVAQEVLPAAADAVDACAGVTFVLDHLGNPEIADRPDEIWAAAIRRLAEHPNVFCKLSGILGEPESAIRPYYATVLDAFGPDRLMFGSDWPPCTLSASYGAVVAGALALIAGLSPSEQAAVLAGTARRAYRLDAS